MSDVSDLLSTDIEQYLRQHETKSLLRFITCGSVDDGKSTLIGRLLYEAKSLFEDQLAAVEAPVTMLRVYCSWPGVSATMNLRLSVVKKR